MPTVKFPAQNDADELIKKLCNLITTYSSATDPIHKELRQFDVKLDPVLRHFAIGALGRTDPNLILVQSDRDQVHLNLKTIKEIIYRGFYAQLDDFASPESISISPSSKTLIGTSNMRELIKEGIRTTGKDGKIPTLREVLQTLQVHVPGYVLPRNDKDCSTSDFFQSLTQLLLPTLNSGEISKDMVKQLRTALNRDCLLTMKTKMYFARGDYRAYFIDKSIVNQICGDLICSLINPSRRKGYRGQEELSTIWPKRNKDKLDLTIVAKEGESVMLVTSDISSFTSSNVNSWFMVYTMILGLQDVWFTKTGGEFLAHLDNYPFSFAILDVLILYLHSTIFADAFVPELNTTHFLRGGYLGVKGNIDLTMLSLSLLLKNLQHDARIAQVFMINQVGGDDNAALLRGAPQSVHSVSQTLNDRLTAYAGCLKTFDRVNLESLTYGIHILSVQYCKRDVYVEVTQDVAHHRRYRIVTREPPPVMDILTAPTTEEITSIKSRNDFAIGLRSVMEHMTDKSGYYWLMSNLFAGMHGPELSQYSWQWGNYLPPSDLVLYNNEIPCTPKVAQMLDRVKPLTWTHGSIRTHARSCLTYLLMTDSVVRCKGLVAGAKYWYVARCQLSSLHRPKIYHSVPRSSTYADKVPIALNLLRIVRAFGL